MGIGSYLDQWLLHLPTPKTRKISRERSLRIPMRDGVTLVAERWAPAAGGDGLPTALIRTYYGTRAGSGTLLARALAERGYQVLVVASRGTFGSGGVAHPLHDEREDGLDVVAWIIEQGWFGDAIVLAGASYLGYTQWAIADLVPEQVKAMIPVLTSSSLMPDFLRADHYQLEIPFGWGIQVATQEERFAELRTEVQERAALKAMDTLPLGEADKVVLGHHDQFIQDTLRRDPGHDAYWTPADHGGTVKDVTIPVSLIGGWYDIMLPGLINDFKKLQAAGRHPRIGIGPWHHLSVATPGYEIREVLDFGLPLAHGQTPPDRPPVLLYVMGRDRSTNRQEVNAKGKAMSKGKGRVMTREKVIGKDAWVGFDSWPPPGYLPTRFYLQPGAGLSQAPPPPGTPTRYRYDPMDPTPALGGARLMLIEKKGPLDNRPLEARRDVLTFTTPVLDSDVEVIGEVSVQIWFRSSRVSADLFVRLCEVDEMGKSVNICDGLITVPNPTELAPVTVELSPTAYLFRAGRRIRVQVSSGAFPRFNRNLGTGEPRAEAVTALVAEQEVFHDPNHPSAIILPVADPVGPAPQAWGRW